MDKSEKIIKLKRIANSYFSVEKCNASRILAKHFSVYIDIAGIEWKKNELLKFSEDKLNYLFGFNPLKL